MIDCDYTLFDSLWVVNEVSLTFETWKPKFHPSPQNLLEIVFNFYASLWSPSVYVDKLQIVAHQGQHRPPRQV